MPAVTVNEILSFHARLACDAIFYKCPIKMETESVMLMYVDPETAPSRNETTI